MIRGLLVVLVFCLSLIGSNMPVKHTAPDMLVARTQADNKITLQKRSTTKLIAFEVEDNPNVSAFYNIQQLSAVTPKSLNQILKGKLTNKGIVFIEAGLKYDIDPAFLAAISIHETGNGTSDAIQEKNNVGGMMRKTGGLMAYSSVDQSIFELARIMKDIYVKNDRTTPKEIQEWYAPINAKNDPNDLNKFWLTSVVENWQLVRKA